VNANIKQIVRDLIYDEELDKVKERISTIDDPKTLSLYIQNYNWDDGFDIPQAVLNNGACDLSVALQIFYLADGFAFLLDRTAKADNTRWYKFITRLYESIITGKFPKGSISFAVPLSKAQIFKVKKNLNDGEKILIENIDGECMDYNL
jgi:hypothetical protein